MNANDTKDPPKLLHEFSFCGSLMIFVDWYQAFFQAKVC